MQCGCITFKRIRDIPTTSPLLGLGLLKASIDTISASPTKKIISMNYYKAVQIKVKTQSIPSNNLLT